MKKTDIHNDILTKEMRRLHDRMPSWLIHLMLLGMLVLFVYHTASLLILLLISGLIAYLLNAIVSQMEYYGIRRIAAVSIIYIFSAVLAISANMLFIPCLKQEISALSAKMPEMTVQVKNALISLDGYPFADKVAEKIMSAVSDPGRVLIGQLNAADIFSHAVSLAFSMVLIPFFVFFILKDWPAFLKTVMKLMPSSYVETTVSIISEVNSISGKYLRGLAIDSIAIVVLSSSGLWILGVNYPVTLGITTGIANVIPYFGPVASCLIAVTIAFFQFKTASSAINVFILYMLIKIVDDLIVQPLSIGRIVKLHPVLLVAGIVASHEVFGIIGMIVAVPSITILQKILAIYMKRGDTSGIKVSQDMKSHQIII